MENTRLDRVGNDSRANDPHIGDCLLAMQRLLLDESDGRVDHLGYTKLCDLLLLRYVDSDLGTSRTIFFSNARANIVIHALKRVLMHISKACIQIVESVEDGIGVVIQQHRQNCDVVGAFKKGARLECLEEGEVSRSAGCMEIVANKSNALHP